MLTKEQIKANLKRDPHWELPDKVSNQEWQWFDEAYEELENAGELNFSDNDDDDDDDEDDSWDMG